jgi:DNA polymerase III subunit gamma/tau
MSPEQSPANPTDHEYVVVARRYRPQNFEELVGQGQVSQALHNAIATNRVGHAYLFTGARGVGKTSTARILAKALNCAEGPTSTPCNQCDICEAVTSGDDIDVIEIDGASNRGIDEIRQLRSNVNVRPSRARFKIYIIDEVHMLTVPAFNALLKTLEEPPEHVKFIFCTTDPEKIPITVLSRCQRFDFAPVETTDIVGRLRFIVESEGAEAEDEALQLLARRAAGSMRDSQSLLEQLLSFSNQRITLDEVQRMLGSARGGRLGDLADALILRDPAAALLELDGALQEGADAGQLTNQMLGYFRDMLTASLGCSPDMLLQASSDDHAKLAEQGKSAGMATLLAIIQLLDHSMTRMRQSVHIRTLLEVALVRICHLEELDDLGQMVANLREGLTPANPAPRQPQASSSSAASGSPSPPRASSPAPSQSSTPALSSPSAPQGSTSRPSEPTSGPQSPAAADGTQKKTGKPSIESQSKSGSSLNRPQLDDKSAWQLWSQVIGSIEDTTQDFASRATRVAISGPNRLVAFFEPSYSFEKGQCERPERRTRIEAGLAEAFGSPIQVEFQLLEGSSQAARPRTPVRQSAASRRQLMKQAERHPMVSEAIEIFDAEMIRMEQGRPGPGKGDA